MSVQPLSSKVAIVEAPPKVRGIPSASTSVAGIIGLADQGPVGEAVLCTSFTEFQETFGDFRADSQLAVAAKGFFENGGRQLWVSRITGGTKASADLSGYSGGDPTPAIVIGTVEPPYAFVNNDDLTIQVVDLSTASSLTIPLPFLGDIAQIWGGRAPFDLRGGRTLELSVDGGATQVVTFSPEQFANPYSATIDEVCAVFNASVTGAHAEGSFFGDLILGTTSRGLASSLVIMGGTAVLGPGLPAVLTQSSAGPFFLQDGDDLFLTINGVQYSVSFQGTPAEARDNSDPPAMEPFALVDGMTLEIDVDSGPTQTITFGVGDFADIGAATAQEVCDVINVQATGVSAAPDNGQVVIATASAGYQSNIAVVGGTAVFGDDAPAVVTGTASEPFNFDQGDPLTIATSSEGFFFQFTSGVEGTFPDVHSVTIAQIQDAFANQGLDEFVQVSNVGGRIQFSSIDTGPSAILQFGDLAASVLGLDTDPHYGNDGNLLGLRDASANGDGNVANVHAVTTTELMQLIYDSGAIDAVFIEDTGTGLAISTLATGPDQSIVPSGDALGVLGFDLAAYGNGDDVLGLADASAQGTGTVANLAAVTYDDILQLALTGGSSGWFDITDTGTELIFSSVALGGNIGLRIGGSVADAMGLDTTTHFGTEGGDLLPVLHVEALESGEAGNELFVAANFPTSGGAIAFDFDVMSLEAVLEHFPDVSRDPNDPRFVETVLASSQYVRVTSLPTIPLNPPVRTLPDFVSLTGGSGGGGGPPDDASYIGSESEGTGLYAFDAVQDLSMIMIPDGATPGVHVALLQYCEQHRDGTVFAILDPPANLTAEEMVDYVTATAGLEEASEFGAIYWPRVTIANPDKSIFGDSDSIVVSPSGIIAGVYARTDAARPGGVYDAPAGIDTGRMFGVLGFESADPLKPRKRDLVYPHRINPLTSSPGRPPYIDGSRTLMGSGVFPFVAARRGVRFIEESLKLGLERVRFRSNTPDLRAEVRRSITAFLLTQMNNGAFQSQDPAKAFYVDISDALNPPSVVASGKLVVRVGLALNRPAEYVVLEISQDTRALDEELAG